MGQRLVTKEFNRLNEAEELEVPCSGEVEDPNTTTEHDQFGARNVWIDGWKDRPERQASCCLSMQASSLAPDYSSY